MSVRTPTNSQTLHLSVKNTGFLLDNLGKDCDPLQFLRELTQNSIESILRTPEKTGEIIWDVDWITYDLVGCYKLCITDNGDGMTGGDMIEYINNLSSSSSIQSHTANFGVGAKIAAATRNHHGLIYLSWKDTVGSMIYLWKDPQDGAYGLQQQSRPDGTFGHWSIVENDVKPELINNHGTKVILMGNAADENTMQAPKGAASPTKWTRKYLNTRYFRFPKGIVIKCREGWENDRSNTDLNVLRKVTGQYEYLEEHKKESGSVKLNTAKIHWWILKDEPSLSGNSGFINSSGHCAALWKDELYDITSGRANTAMLQNFGIIFGYTRVVLYVEPKSLPGAEILSNTARTALLINGKSLPWAEWQDEFREKMPKEIIQHMEEISAAADKSDHTNSIKDRLKQIEDLYKLSRYRTTSSGKLAVAGEAPALGGGNRIEATSTENSSSAPNTALTQQNAGKTPSVYTLFLSSEGAPGAEAKPDIFPKVNWVSTSDKTRPPGDMEDRAARYLPKENRLLINADFRVFTDMINRYETIYKGAKVVITEVMREWFEQSLVELVISSNALHGAQHWNQENINTGLLSEEALTAAVLPRYHIDQSIKRTLGTKLGSTKSKAA